MNSCPCIHLLRHRQEGGKRTVLVSVSTLSYPLPMQTGNRFRAYSTPAQEQILFQWIGHQWFVYNARVLEDRYSRTFAKKAVSLSGTPVPVDQEYDRFIGENTPWLRDVPSQILKNGARAKAGLNKAILSSCWGLFILFL